MAGKSTSGRIILPDLTAAQLAAQNPVLKKRQLQFEGDTGKAKVGDGVTHWNELPYRIGAGTNGSGCSIFKISNGSTIDVNEPMVPLEEYIIDSNVAGYSSSGLIALEGPGTYLFEVNTLITFDTQPYSITDAAFYIADEELTDWSISIPGSRTYGSTDSEKFNYAYTGAAPYYAPDGGLQVRLVAGSANGVVINNGFVIVRKISDQPPIPWQ